jgi:transposase
LSEIKLSGIIEIDESLLGRRRKYERGVQIGMHVWIFGLLERPSDKKKTCRILLYPVDVRTRDSLIPIIQKHVAEGSTIYSDSWGAYNSLNDLGYRHFVVCHKYNYLKIYRDKITGMFYSSRNIHYLK